MNLLDERRRKTKEVSSRRGKTITEVIYDLQRELVHPTYAQLPKRGGLQPWSRGSQSPKKKQDKSLALAIPSNSVHASQREVAEFSNRHVEECQGLFAKEEKKANVREIVRDIMTGVTQGASTGKTSQAINFPKSFDLTPYVSDRRAPAQTSRRQRTQRKPALFKQFRNSLLMQQSIDVIPFAPQDDNRNTAGEDLLAAALFGRHIAETLLLAVVTWHEMVRRDRYERKRAAMQSALIWDDPGRALVLMRVRETLVAADRLSWFRVDTRNAKHKFSDVRSAFPLTAPPVLRGDTCDDFANLADSARHQIKDMVLQQQARLSEQEHEMDCLEGWMMKEKSKDIRKLQREDEDKMRRLESTKRQLAQTPVFLSLIERMFLACIVRSIENAATFLSQIFTDTACLQIRVMVVPHLPISSRGSSSGISEFERGVALFPSPTHAEVQEHLNTLLQSVLTAATSVMTIREEVKAHLVDRTEGQPSVGTWKAPTKGDLHRLLLVSQPYKKAVENLDRQLARSFKSVEQRLKRISKQFGVPLLMRISLLSEFYRDRGRLVKHMNRSACDGQFGKTGPDSISLPTFLLFWFAGPHAKLDSIGPILRPLFLCVAQLFSDTSEFSSEFVVGPPDATQPSPSGGKGVGGKDEVTSSRNDDSGVTGFHSSLLAVAQGATCLADFILRLLIRLEQPKESSMQPVNVLHDLDHTTALCNWFQAQVEQCQQWQDAVRELRIVYQCGPFALDTKYLAFIASQIASAVLGSSIYLLNLYAVFNGKVLWRNVQNTVRELNQQVSSVGELVQQMQLLSGIYPLIARYHNGKKQLERILYTLTCVVRDPLLADNVARLVGHHVQLDDHSGSAGSNVVDAHGNSEGFGPGVHHPGGSLSTNLLFFLVKRIEESLGKLESRTDEVVATTARRVIPFHHKVQDEIMTVNSNARAIRVDMEQTLEPNPTLANDVRCRAILRSSGGPGDDPPAQEKTEENEKTESRNTSKTKPRVRDTTVPASDGGTQLDPEQQLTVGGIRNYADIEVRLANFEKRCQELENWRKLILQFEEFANQESISLSVPVVSIDTVLLQKLAELKVFWSSASEWDRSVDRYLQMRPDQVRVNDVQRQAHVTLFAIRACPKEHQKLLRERVDCFRRVLQPLFSVQVLISMSPSRALGANESADQVKPSGQQGALPVASPGRAQTPSLAVLGTASTVGATGVEPGSPPAGVSKGTTHTMPRPTQVAGVAAFLKSQGNQAGPSQGDVPEESIVFAPEQNHIWEGLFGPVPQSTSDRSGISEVVETIVNLRALVRTGALYRTEQVKHQYELAMREMNVVSRLLEVVGHWSHKLLPIVALAVSGKKESAFVVGSGSSLVQRLEEHITVIEEVLDQSRVYGSSIEDEQIPDGTSRARNLTFVSSAYLSLAREWHARMTRMLEHCVQFLECQEEWLKMSVLLRCQVPPTGKGGIALRVADKEFREVIAEMTEFPVLRHCFEDVLNSQHLEAIAGRLRNAKQMLKEDLTAMRCQCHRLFFVEDNLLMRVWGFTGLRDMEEQTTIVNAVIPKMFPGWQHCLFAPLRGGIQGLRVVGAGPAAPGMPLMLKHAVPLIGTPDQWVNELQNEISHTFQVELQELAPFVAEDVLQEMHDQMQEELDHSDDEHHRWQDGRVTTNTSIRATEDELIDRDSAQSPNIRSKASSTDGARSHLSSSMCENLGSDATATSTPDHILVTAERIKWSALVESWSEEADGTSLLIKYIAQQHNAVLRCSHRNSAVITFVLECKDMLDRAQHERLRASQLMFVRVGWKAPGHLAVGLDYMHLDFGWEFYGSTYLSCPVSERNLVVISQQLNTSKSTLLQGKLGGTVTQGFAAVCGIPCHEAYVLPKEESLVDFYSQLLGCGLSGHWIMLQGIENLEENMLNSLLKHLGTFFNQLTLSIRIFSETFLQSVSKQEHDHNWSSRVDSSRFLSCPAGVMRVRETLCAVDSQRIQLPLQFQKYQKNMNGDNLKRSASSPEIGRKKRTGLSGSRTFRRYASCPPRSPAGSDDHVDLHGGRIGSKGGRPRNGDYDAEAEFGRTPSKNSRRLSKGSRKPSKNNHPSTRKASKESRKTSKLLLRAPIDTGEGSMYIPRIMHPRTAVFVAPLTSRRELKSFIFRIAAIHKADLLLYIRAGLIRAGIFDPDVAKTFSHAINAFNSYTGGHNNNGTEKQKFSKHLGVPEVRSVCSLAASLRRSRASQADSVVDDHTLLCEAWLCGISALLDATTERELLWHCTVLTFGNIPKFAEKEVTFRQNLFNDTLVSQRFIKKDLNARLYDQIADTLKQKYSFFNPLIVQKCLATSNALLQQRHVAVIGEAGTGKTDCVSTLLEAGRNFADDQGEDLFPRVKLLRVNTIAHNTHHIIKTITRASQEHTPDSSSKVPSVGEGTWLVLDGPIEPVLLSSVSTPTPLHLLDGDPVLLSPLNLRVIIETDQLCHASPAFASALAITFIDTNRGPTWKDKVVAWSHQLVGACPEYAMLMGIVRDLLVQLMDSILAFVLYYFHSAARDDNSAGASADTSVALLDYKHQTTSFLSYFTSLLLDPVIEEQLREAAAQEADDMDKSPLERHVRLLIAMASICSFGSCLFTHQRSRFERYVRERVLHPIHAEALPPLYDLYFDSKTGTFQAVTELVRLSEPIIEDHCICVATEEFIAFQLRLRRLTALAVPIMLAGTAGSGKSTLLRYLLGAPSPGCLFIKYRTSTSSTASDLQGVVMHRLRVQDGAFLAPPTGKRFVVLIDDLHMGNYYSVARSGRQRHGGEDSSSVFGGYSALAEWMRFVIEHRGFYNSHDHTFMSVRDVSFLPTLLSPDSQSLPFCKRYTRHFFVVFMEIPSHESIEKIFSTVLDMNLSSVLGDLINSIDQRNSPLEMFSTKQNHDSSKQLLIGNILEATLAVCKEAELGAKQRLHGLARVFCDLSHTFELAPTSELRSVPDVGFLWAYAMRTFVLDASLQVEQQHRRRQVYSAIVRACANSFGAVLGREEPQKKASNLDPEAQAAELDALVYTSFTEPVCAGSAGGRDLVVQRGSIYNARIDLLKYLSHFAPVTGKTSVASSSSTPGDGDYELDMETSDRVVADTTFAASQAASANFEAFKELLCEDGIATALWLHDDALLSALLRLCHTMYLHPVVCVIGGWAHFPLLGLVSRLYGGEEVRMCTRVSAEALEQELLGEAAATSSAPLRSAEADGPQAPRQAASGLRILAIDEEEVPASAMASFLHRERGRYFRPRKANKHPGRDLPDGQVPEIPTDVTLAEQFGHTAAESHQEAHTCVAIICRSPVSFQALATRCVFVQHVVSATFVLPLAVGFHQVAVAYLPNRLSGVVPMNALPKQQKRFNFMSKKSTMSVSSGPSDFSSRGSGDIRVFAEDFCGPSELEKTLFSPLAQATEALHVRIQQCLQHEYGKDFASEYCTPFRFSQFLRSLARLARQFFASQEFKTTKYSSALETLEALQRLSTALDAELRSVRVSLRLLIEEAGRLTSRVARVTAKRATAREVLAKTKKRQQALEARIMAVDSRYGGEFSKAQHAVELTLRELGRLDPQVYEGLAKFIHPPLPIIKTLETVHTVVSYLRQLEEEAAEAQIADAAPTPTNETSQRQLIGSSEQEVGGSHMAATNRQSSQIRAGKSELEKWRETVATKEVLPRLQQWSTRSHLPVWLAVLLDEYAADSTCHPHALREMSPAAAHMAAWLTARLNCHKVLDKIETKRQSMGDLSQQMSTLNEELTGATNDVTKAEDELKELMQSHTETVQLREKQMKDERRLQDRVQRVRENLLSYSVRKREYETQAQNVHDRAELPEQWGGLLQISSLSIYAAAFNPVVRKAIMHEVADALRDFDISSPKDLVATTYLKSFLPSAFLHLAESHWHDRYMYDSVTMMELANTRCNIIFDPFEQGLDWLQDVYTQIYPEIPHGQLVPCTGEIKQAPKQPPPEADQLMTHSVAERSPRIQLIGQTGGTAGAPTSLEKGSLWPQGHSTPPTIITCGCPAPIILQHIQRCMQEGSVLIIQCHAIAQLEGFIGDLLVLLQTAESGLSICTTGASAQVRVQPQRCRPNPTQSNHSQQQTQGGPVIADVQLFDLLQQLEHALPLPYKLFRLFVLVPRCTWNAVLWGPLRKKRAEQLRGFPAKLWSVCHIVSLDSRPVHPCRVMLNAFNAAKESASTSAEFETRKHTFAVQNTQLQVIEDVLASLLVTAEHNALDSETLHSEVVRFRSFAEQLASSVADCSYKLRVRSQQNMERHLQLAGSAVVLMCALMDAEAARGGSSIHEEWRTDKLGVHRLNVHVDGFSIAPGVMHQLLFHLLRSIADPREAIAQMLTMVVSSMSERHAAILRVMLVLEGGLVRQKDLATLWDSLARHAAGQVHEKDTVAPRLSQSTVSRMGGKRGSVEAMKRGSVHSTAWLDSERPSIIHKHTGVSRADSPPQVSRAQSPGVDSGEFSGDEKSVLSSDLGSQIPASEYGSRDSEGSAERESEGSNGDGKADQHDAQLVSIGFLEGDTLTNRKDLLDLVRQLCKVVGSSFPAGHPKRTFEEQLKQLPPQVPLMVPHNSIAVVSSMAAMLGIEIKEVANLEGLDLFFEFKSIFSTSNIWLLFDLADIMDYGDLAQALQHLQSQRCPNPAGYKPKRAPSKGVDIGVTCARQSHGEKTWLDASRLFLYCSGESTVVPRYILRLCFCMQSVLRFFGLRPKGIQETKDTLSSGEEDLSDEDATPMSPQLSSSLTPTSFTKEKPMNARSSLRHLAVDGNYTDPIATELINYLSFTHPLLTMQALSSHDDKFISVMGDIISALHSANVKEVVNCTLEQVPEWIEQNVVLPAQTWVQKSAIYAMLQTFSPTLIRQNDMQLKETLHLLSTKLCGMLQRVSATASLLTSDSPFWLLLELHRTATRLQAARADLTACYSALLGDIHWNSHLFAVYTAAAHGRAIWAASRPLATWLASLEEHVTFLTTWKPDSADLMSFRIGSVSDIGSFFSSYTRDTERFHLRLEKKPTASLSATKTDVGRKTSAMAMSRQTSETPQNGQRGSDSGRASPFKEVPVGRTETTESLSLTQSRQASSACLLIEGLRLLGGSWTTNRISDIQDAHDSDFEVDLPPMVIRPMKGAPPKSNEWYSCPLVVAHADAYGNDAGTPPIAHVLVRTSVHPALCAVRGVRLVSYA